MISRKLNLVFLVALSLGLIIFIASLGYSLREGYSVKVESYSCYERLNDSIDLYITGETEWGYMDHVHKRKITFINRRSKIKFKSINLPNSTDKKEFKLYKTHLNHGIDSSEVYLIWDSNREAIGIESKTYKNIDSKLIKSENIDWESLDAIARKIGNCKY